MARNVWRMMRRQMRKVGRWRGGGRGARLAWPGQSIVEFTLVSLFGLLPMVFGLVEIGRGVWYYNQLAQLSREGARWVIVTSHDPATPTYAATCNAPGTYTVGSAGCPANTAVGWIGQKDTGIPADQLQVVIARSYNPGADGLLTGVPVTVTVTYPYRPILASYLNIPATITLRAATTMHMQ